MSSLHEPAVRAQAFTTFYALPGNAAEDSSLLEVPPAGALLQAFDCWDGIPTLLKLHRIVSVSSADKNHQLNTMSIHDDVAFGA